MGSVRLSARLKPVFFESWSLLVRDRLVDHSYRGMALQLTQCAKSDLFCIVDSIKVV